MGRLSNEDIEKMVADAEKYKAADDQQKERISAKNGLESYCFNIKSTAEDEKLKDRIPESDRKIILEKCNEIINWLDQNQSAEIDEFQDKQKEIEGICKPIISKLYQQAQGTNNSGSCWKSKWTRFCKKSWTYC